MNKAILIVLGLVVVIAEGLLVDACWRVQRASGAVCEANGYTAIYSPFGNLKKCVKRVQP